METKEAYSFKEYRNIERMNASTLVHGLHSMRRLKRYIDKGGEEESTLCKELGVATHALLLEPEEFERQYVVMPDFHLMPENKTAKGEQTESKNSKFYRDRVSEFAVANRGKIIIGREQFDKCLYAIECIRSHHSAPALIEGAKFEQTLQGEIGGVLFKGRIDILKPGLIADLKTTFNAEERTFGRTAANQNYAFKLAIYRELYRQEFGEVADVQILVQEIGGDYDTCITNVPDIVLDNKFAEVLRVILHYKVCQSTGSWPGVDKGMKQVELYVPNWAMPEDDLVEVGDEI